MSLDNLFRSSFDCWRRGGGETKLPSTYIKKDGPDSLWPAVVGQQSSKAVLVNPQIKETNFDLRVHTSIGNKIYIVVFNKENVGMISYTLPLSPPPRWRKLTEASRHDD